VGAQDELAVEVAGLAGQARAICAIAEDLGVAAAKWRRALDSPVAAFASQEPTDALTGVRDAWDMDFRVYREVLERWCQAAQAAAAGYRSADDHVAQRLHVLPRHNLPR
jgi:hypothetical protein